MTEQMFTYFSTAIGILVTLGTAFLMSQIGRR